MSGFADMSFVGVDPLQVLPNTVELANLVGVELSETPTSEQLDELVEAFGKNRAYDHNVSPLAQALGIDNGLPPKHVLDLMEAGAKLLLTEFAPRNIFGDRLPDDSAVLAWITAGTANWSARRVNLLKKTVAAHNLGLIDIVATGTTRLCNLPTEQHMSGQTTEIDHLCNLLDAAGDPLKSNHSGYPSNDETWSMAQQAERLAGYPYRPFNKLSQYDLLVPVNAGALNVPLELVTVFSRRVPGFNPARLYFTQDPFELATTSEQLEDRTTYQNPWTLFSAWGRLVKAVHELNQ